MLLKTIIYKSQNNEYLLDSLFRFKRNKSHLDYKDYVKQLQRNNEAYKQRLLLYQNQETISQDIPFLMCQIDELVDEISSLKNK